jgi:hypothetical protein
MSTQNTIFVEIENYIRDLITKNSGVFERNYIMMQSNEWMQNFPVEFNSILNFIESEGRNDEMMDDSTPSVAFGSRFDDDSTPSVAFGSRFDDSTPSVAFGSRFDDESPSVAFGSRFDDDSTPSVAFGSRFADDSTPSVAFGSRFDDDSTPSVAFGSRFADDSTPSVAFGSRFADDSTPSVAFGSRFDDESPSVAYHGGYANDFPKDPISSVDYSPKADSMGSDYSPCGNQDDEESDMPLQRTMSCAP